MAAPVGAVTVTKEKITPYKNMGAGGRVIFIRGSFFHFGRDVIGGANVT